MIRRQHIDHDRMAKPDEEESSLEDEKVLGLQVTDCGCVCACVRVSIEPHNSLASLEIQACVPFSSSPSFFLLCTLPSTSPWKRATTRDPDGGKACQGRRDCWASNALCPTTSPSQWGSSEQANERMIKARQEEEEQSGLRCMNTAVVCVKRWRLRGFRSSKGLAPSCLIGLVQYWHGPLHTN